MADAAFYRQRAAEMRAKAEKAATEELRASYLVVAEDWDRLADTADFAAVKSPPTGSQPNP